MRSLAACVNQMKGQKILVLKGHRKVRLHDMPKHKRKLGFTHNILYHISPRKAKSHPHL